MVYKKNKRLCFKITTSTISSINAVGKIEIVNELKRLEIT